MAALLRSTKTLRTTLTGGPAVALATPEADSGHSRNTQELGGRPFLELDQLLVGHERRPSRRSHAEIQDSTGG